MILTVALLLQAASPEADAQGDDVVVVAKRDRCDLRIANRIIAGREFRARAKEWAAGRRVRVVVPRGSKIQCEAKIMFRLGRYGVTRAVFVDE